MGMKPVADPGERLPDPKGGLFKGAGRWYAWAFATDMPLFVALAKAAERRHNLQQKE